MRSNTRDIHDAAGLAKLDLSELNYEIECCRARMKLVRSAAAKRAFSDRGKWLELFKAKHHRFLSPAD